VSWGTELEFQNLQLVSTDILQRDFELSVLTGSEYPDFSTPNVSVNTKKLHLKIGGGGEGDADNVYSTSAFSTVQNHQMTGHMKTIPILALSDSEVIMLH
jgi:hypothetical protein